MSNQRTLLGFDFGIKRIGIAVGQELTATASPLDTILASNGEPDWIAVTRHINDWRASALVVGIPYNMDGTEHELTQRARRFANRLEQRFQLPVYAVDERLSSVEAERMLSEGGRMPRARKQKKELIDQVAAQLILNTYFSQLETQADRNVAETLPQV